MKLNSFLLLLILCSFGGFANAQSIKFKNGIVLIDQEECLKYDNSDPNNLEISSMDGSQTIFLKYIRTGVGASDGLYTKVIFVEQNKSLTSRSYIFTKKLLVKKMLYDGVITDCKLDLTKIDRFITKYDENIEETLIRL